MRILMIIFWLIFGSFGSVILYRFADGVTRANLRGFFFWRSQCPHCHHQLGTTDLIPIVSYLTHGWKCRYCWTSISWTYPILEILSASIFLWTYLLMSDFWRWIIIFWITTNRLLLLVLIYDIQTYELHMTTRSLLSIVWAIGNLFLPNNNIWNALFSTIFFTWTFLLIYFFAKRYVKIRFHKKKEWFGEGDIYLSFIIWLYIPIIIASHHMLFSWSMMIKVLILFVLISSIIWLIRAGLQYILIHILNIWHHKHSTWKKSTYNSIISHFSSLQIIPFFPSMIIAFRILAWKIQFFITLIFW